MSFFKVTNTYSGMTSFFNGIDALTDCVLKKYFQINVSGYNCTLTSTIEDMSYSVTSAYGKTTSTRYFFTNSLITTSFPVSESTASNVIKYGDISDSDLFTLYDETSGNVLSCVNWTDDNEYAYTLYMFNGNASMATTNPDIADGSSYFNLKDFGTNFITQIKAVNAKADKYVIQPLIVWGIKTPVYLITGAYSANVPLFSEFAVGNDTYFVIGSNYCIKI